MVFVLSDPRDRHGVGEAASRPLMHGVTPASVRASSGDVESILTAEDDPSRLEVNLEVTSLPAVPDHLIVNAVDLITGENSAKFHHHKLFIENLSDALNFSVESESRHDPQPNNWRNMKLHRSVISSTPDIRRADRHPQIAFVGHATSLPRRRDPLRCPPVLVLSDRRGGNGLDGDRLHPGVRGNVEPDRPAAARSIGRRGGWLGLRGLGVGHGRVGRARAACTPPGPFVQVNAPIASWTMGASRFQLAVRQPTSARRSLAFSRRISMSLAGRPSRASRRSAS